MLGTKARCSCFARRIRCREGNSDVMLARFAIKRARCHKNSPLTTPAHTAPALFIPGRPRIEARFRVINAEAGSPKGWKNQFPAGPIAPALFLDMLIFCQRCSDRTLDGCRHDEAQVFSGQKKRA